MNKIYKVIWSKVRNCYVAVSEIAKRNGKSCTSVNCGGKANRSRGLRMAAVTLGVTAALVGGVGFGTPAAWADGTITVGDASQPQNYTTTTGGTLYYSSGFYCPSDPSINQLKITGGVNNSYGFAARYTYGSGESVTGYTVDVSGAGTSINFAFGIRITDDSSGERAASGNRVYITDGASVSGNVYGADGIGVVSGNMVTIDKAYAYRVVGGESGVAAKGNIVNISGIKEGMAYTVSDYVRGGNSMSGMAGGTGENEGNKVNISNGAIVGIYDAVIGGNGGGGAIGNEVTINKSLVENYVLGGSASSGSASKNTVDISGKMDGKNYTVTGSVYGGITFNGTASGNIVKITDAVVNKNSDYSVYGGSSRSNVANSNNVTVSGNSKTCTVYGGYSDTGAAKGNTVTINKNEKGETPQIEGYIYGGYSEKGTAGGATAEEGNKVTISGGTVDYYVYGGYVNSGTGAATGNKVDISQTDTEVLTKINGKVYGGYSQSGTAGGTGENDGNKVTISGGTVGNEVYGGYVGSGSAINNSVDISGDSIVSDVYGGVITSFFGSGEASNNKVIISGNNTTIKGRVYGAAVYGPQDVKYNSVKIEGNKESTENNVYVYGGVALNYGVGIVEGNSVEITGGTVYYVCGGSNSWSSGTTSDVKGNSVTIRGGDSTVIKTNVYGAWSGGNGNVINNTVSLLGANVIGSVYGGFVANGTNATSGNKLVLSSTNTVGGTIKNFETIQLDSSLVWSNGATVLKAAKFDTNATTEEDKKRASLDITAAETNLATATSGQMTLLASNTANDFNTLSLIYSGSDSPVALSETNQYKVLKSGAETTETTPVNGVTLTYASSHMVSLDADNSYKNVLYKVESIPSKVTMGAMSWGTGRDLAGAFTFGSGAVVDATNLTFANTTTVLKKNDTMTLLANATGITADHTVTPPGTGNGTIGISYSDTGTGISYEATASGKVTADTNAVKYTVNSVTADKITLGSQAWGTVADLPDASWTASATTQIDDTGFAYTGTASTALKKNDTATILNAPGLVTDSPVTGGTSAGKTVLVNYKDDPGVTYTATASGHVAAAADAVSYVVDSVAATGVDLSDWNGTDASSVVTTNGWTGTGIAVATGSFAAPTDLNLGETRTIATAPTGFFGAVTGTNAHPQKGGALDEDEGGVKLSGNMIGGVKAEDDGTTAKLTYYAMKKTADTMTLGTFAFVDGDANARTYGKEYDLTNAEITTGGLAFTEDSKKAMEAGNKMTLVDASGAYKNGGAALKALSSGAKTSFDVEFSDDPVAVTDQSNITVSGKHTDTLAMVDSQKLEYTVGNKVVGTAKLDGTINWVDNGTHYTNKKYQFDGSSKVDIDAPKGSTPGLQFTSTTDPLNQSMTLIQNASGLVSTNVSGTPDFTVALNNTTLEATATGSAAIDSGNLKYTVNSVTLNQVNVAAVGSDAVPAGWTAATNVTVDTENMTLPSEVAYRTPQNILTADSAIFTDDNITGKNKYGATPAAFADTDSAGTPAVTIAGQRDQGVKASADGKSLVYEVGTKEASSVTLGSMQWASGTEVMDGSSVEYDYKSVTSLGTDGFAMAFEAPETMDAGKGESMTLLKANATLADMSEQVKKTAYSYNPVSGVTVDAAITGKLTTSGGAVTYTPMANQASKLTFTSVDWKDSGALMTRPSNITFAGADVDTTKIHFKNIKELDANKKMTLVSDFGDSVGTITGTKYMVGAGLEGEGAASLSGSDLIFTTKTGANDLAAQEQTHNTLMVMEAGMAVLAAGNEHVEQAMAGLANTQNAAVDGTVTAASMGGSKSRYKTGSHVDSNSWNVAVAVGSKRELTKGSLEWGVFGEYGKSNYTLHSDAGRGDGDSHYAGGGLMAKWTNKHDVYTEASVRLGRLNDTASNLLRDAAGNGYGYDVHANYFGAHVGIGKIINYKGGKSLDVYGKYFYTKRDGVDFASGGNNYSLDSVASSVLRVGARYGTTDKKWNWYGGLAYEYEFDGKSEGTVDGVGIRAASVKGGSVRGEIGLRMSATKTNPWQTDISIYGYGGKHRGFGGSVNVAYMF